MRNLKRVLSLALALVMVLGMMVITTSAADFTDADEITYTEAMDVMAGLGVFKGNPDGSVAPTQVLTRKDAAVIIARIILGEKMAESLSATKQIFEDVPADEWYAAEVEYCNNINMIVGHGGKFNPDGELTGTEFAKLLLCAMGYDADVEGYVGDKWDNNINADAMRIGLNIEGVKLTDKLTREGAAQMLFQALEKDMVKYRSSYDKATGASTLTGPFPTGKDFKGQFFQNLVKVEGIVSAVELYQGTTTIGTQKVSNTDANFKNIGYAAHVWALKGTKEYLRTTTAISDVIVEGTSLGVNTNGASFYDMTDEDEYDFIAEMDETYEMYYNGILAAAYEYNTVTDKITEVVKNADAYAAYKAALGKVGTKVDFVDNDNKGMAEAVIVTEYTFAEVTRVLKESKSGEVSVKYYELTTKFGPEKKDWDVELVKPSEMVGATELAKGDYVTYVAYDKETYAGDANDYNTYLTNVLEVAEGEFESITRTKLYSGANSYVRVYNIDGDGYVKSDLSAYANSSYLNSLNINKDVVYVLDQYGYIVNVAEPAADPDSYLYVFDNEHSKVLTGLAETLVAYIDGSVELVNVNKKVAHSALADQIFTFEVKNGAYNLGDAEYEKLTVAEYETFEVTMPGIGDLTYTTVVDLRDVLAGKADNGTVYVGYTEIPSFLNGTLLYIEDIDLAFLTAGKAPASAVDASASFVVFNTKTNIVDRVKVGNSYEYTYELEAGVLVKGELVPNFILSAYQKAMIDTYGVGVYTFAKNGTLAAYTSFAEDTIKWTPEDNGTIIIDNVDVTAAGIFNDIIILDISYGEIDEWWQLVQAGDYYSYTDAKNKILYVVGDATVEDNGDPYWDSILAWKSGDPDGEINGKQYWSYSGYVTNYEEAPEAVVVANNLREVVINGVKVTTVSGGAGTQADPYQVVAVDCFDGVAKASLKVVAKYTDNKIDIFNGAFTGEGIVETGEGWEFNANNKFTFTIDGTYYVATIEVLNHEAALTAKDATKVKVDPDVIQVASTYANENSLTEAALKAVLTVSEDAVAEYDMAAKTVTVTSECGETETVYTIVFVEYPFA